MKYNVVVIVSDQHKASAMGCSGHPLVQTPNLDALAKDGVKFTHAYCASPLCAPSRAAYITSTMPHQNSAMFHVNHVDGKPTSSGYHRFPGYRAGLTTMGEYFKNNGYSTAAIGKMHVHGETREHDLGFETRKLRFYTYDFEDYEQAINEGNPELGKRKRLQYTSRDEAGFPYDYSWTGQYNNADINRCPAIIETMEEGILEESEMFDVLVTEESIEYIEENQEKPFLLHVGLEKPHPPWTEVERFMKMYSAEDITDDLLPLSWNEENRPYLMDWCQGAPSKEQVKIAQASYYANVTSLDERVGQIVKKLKDTGLYEKTVIVYMSDHGEMCYEHAQIEKHCMYEASVRVPFIIKGPGIPCGDVCDYPTSLIDLLPTLGSICGLEAEKSFLGEDLLPVIINEKKSDAKIVYSEICLNGCSSHPEGSSRMVPTRMVRDSKYKYIYTHNLPDQLYAVDSDEIFSSDNLSAKMPDVVKKMKAFALAGWASDGLMVKYSDEKDIEDLLGDNHLRCKIHEDSPDFLTIKLELQNSISTWNNTNAALEIQEVEQIVVYHSDSDKFHDASELLAVDISDLKEGILRLEKENINKNIWIIAKNEFSTLAASKRLLLA